MALMASVLPRSPSNSSTYLWNGQNYLNPGIASTSFIVFQVLPRQRPSGTTSNLNRYPEARVETILIVFLVNRIGKLNYNSSTLLDDYLLKTPSDAWIRKYYLQLWISVLVTTPSISLLQEQLAILQFIVANYGYAHSSVDTVQNTTLVFLPSYVVVTHLFTIGHQSGQVGLRAIGNHIPR